MFTNEMLEKCCCTKEQLDEAMQKGEKIIVESFEGRVEAYKYNNKLYICLLYTSPSPRDRG